jgi:hypothetical protein
VSRATSDARLLVTPVDLDVTLPWVWPLASPFGAALLAAMLWMTLD